MPTVYVTAQWQCCGRGGLLGAFLPVERVNLAAVLWSEGAAGFTNRQDSRHGWLCQ